MEGHTTDDEQCVCPSVGVEIVRTVAEQTGCEPTTLPPLYEYVDPDALELLDATSLPPRGGKHVVTIHYVVERAETTGVPTAGTDATPGEVE